MAGGIAIGGLALLWCSISLAAEVQDVRLTSPHDKDHPADFKPDFADRAAWERRSDFLRHQAMVAQGLWPEPAKTPLNPVIHGKIDREEYTIEKVFFASMPGHYVSGNLYRPKNKSGKLPAVLCPYGHWPDGRFIWKSDADIDKEIKSGAETDRDAARSPLQANCAMLARMGCIVFQYDMVGYCDSTKIPHREGFLDVDAILHLQSFMGLQTWNSVRALDFVLSLPDVDAKRIAVTGSSSGGTQTIALNAVDGRADVSFPMVMVSMNMQGGCVCENAPLYRIGTNNVELASLVAPKPEGMAAANDWTRDFMTRGLPEMKSIWRLYGAEELVDGHHIEFGHNHNLHSRELQYAFLNKHLKLGLTEPVKEKPFVPVPPKELSVYDEQHPLPRDAADAATLRKTMTRMCDEQLAAMNPQQYEQTLRVALQAMVVDSLPAADDVQMEDGYLTRRGAGEHVVCRLVATSGESKGVVIWAHLQGVSSIGQAQQLVDAGFEVLAIDPFTPPAKPLQLPSVKPNPNPPYAGYALCYERSALGNRVHDLLTAIAWAKAHAKGKPVRLIGTDSAAPAALLARALAGDVVDRAALDVNQFDFDKISSDADLMLLPGALKYGGIYGVVPLCANHQTLLCGARKTGRFELARRTPGVDIETESRDVPALVRWLLQ
jgi:dienelactone hydrolase